MKYVIALLVLVATAYAGPIEVTSPLPQLIRHEESHDEDGHHVEFELDDGYLFREISKKAIGPEGEIFFRREGLYRYRPHPDAEIVEVKYKADENGFRAEGGHLP